MQDVDQQGVTPHLRKKGKLRRIKLLRQLSLANLPAQPGPQQEHEDPGQDRKIISGIKALVDKAEEKTKSGIILSSAAQEKPQFATVVAVGPGGVVDGKEVEMYVKEGDKVIASKYAGTQVKIDGEEYTIVGQSDILATLE